ncbi:MAG: DUF2288 family protein [Bdellovibrionales bacterium]
MTEEEISEKLKSELQTVEWEALESHLKRDGIILVDPTLDIIEIGLYLAMDKVDEVKSLMNSQKIIKVTDEMASEWKKERKFVFLIIQPFVIVQAMQ